MYTRQMLSASRGKPEYLNNVYYLHMYGTIYRLQCVFSYAGSESVYGVDVEVVRHGSLLYNRWYSNLWLYQENKL